MRGRPRRRRTETSRPSTTPIAHDLRAPLRGIDGFSHLLLEDYGKTLDAEGQRYLQRVRDAAKHMGRLIDSLLALGHVTQASIRSQQVDLSELARATAERLKESQPDRVVEFVIGDGLTEKGDGTLLGAAIENLAGQRVEVHAKLTEGAHRVRGHPRGRARLPTSSATTARASTWPSPRNSSVSFSGFTGPPNSRGPALAWRPFSGSCIATAAAYGRRAGLARGPASTLPSGIASIREHHVQKLGADSGKACYARACRAPPGAGLDHLATTMRLRPASFAS